MVVVVEYTVIIMAEPKYDVTFEVGEPMTREQMESVEAWDKEQKSLGLPGTGAGSIVSSDGTSMLPPELPTPGLPPLPAVALFNDEPVGGRRVVLFAAVSDLLPQRHVSGATLMKIKAAANGHKDAASIAARMCNPERVNVYAADMFKFFFVPPLDFEVSNSDRDAVIECALMAHVKEIRFAKEESDKRKKMMMEAMRRQGDAIRGRDDVTERESASVCPEPVITPDDGGDAKKGEEEEEEEEVLPSDEALSHERFAVLTCVDLEPIANKIAALDPRVETRGRVLVKVSGVFDALDEAEAYVRRLKKEDDRYAHYDIGVVNMYEWVRIPPCIEELDRVVYEDDRLTSLLGTAERNKKVPAMRDIGEC